MSGQIIRVLVLAGSARRETNCPAADSKASFLTNRIKEKLPAGWKVDVLNLANNYVLPKIQSCNACVSTSMALCVWPCNCYKRHSFFEPDLMWDEDAYGRIYAADAILIVSPVNWYAPTSNLKLFFDRLVCANGGNPNEKLINHKDGALAVQLENSPRWRDLTANHLEGRTAGFFVYGDQGASDLESDGTPIILKHKEYFINGAEEEALTSPRRGYLPFIWQCRYSGIEVPEDLVRESSFGFGVKAGANQIPELKKNEKILKEFDDWVKKAELFILQKGKVPSGKFPVALQKPDAALHPLLRQAQLFFRTVLGNCWLHSLGYFTSRRAAKKFRLYKT